MGLFKPSRVAHGHCDLFCGVYDPAQARIEAQSVYNAAEKYHAAGDPVFRDRCIAIKEQQAELVKHHLSVLWTDFFKPHHLEAHPGLHDLFWQAIKQAGEAKKSMALEDSQRLIDLIEEISGVFWSTEESKAAGVYPPS